MTVEVARGKGEGVKKSLSYLPRIKYGAGSLQKGDDSAQKGVACEEGRQPLFLFLPPSRREGG